MASLRSMILDGRITRPRTGPPEMQTRYRERAEFTEQALKSRDTILVDITSVASDVQTANQEGTDADWQKLVDLASVACPKPPFRQMWLEGKGTLLHVGFLVRRKESATPYGRQRQPYPPETAAAQLQQKLEAAKADVSVMAWLNLKGNVIYLGQFGYLLDADGDFLVRGDSCLRDEVKEEDGNQDDRFRNAFRVVQLWVFHAFSRMNCHNVKLVPMTAGAPKVKNSAKHPPFSIWHEIVVTGLPELRREQGENAPDGEKREVRFHKVKGHYADYRKGKGLFGRLKVRLWIEEHTAGNPELGTVVGSYKVAGSN
jgi:hypothetical protein